MNRQVDVKALISHIVRGDGLDKCRICMGDTSEGQVYLGDTVMMDGDKAVSLAELLETITGVQVEDVLLLPKAICHECYSELQATVNFMKFVKMSTSRWWDAVRDLSAINCKKNTKTAYHIIGENVKTITETMRSKAKKAENPSEVLQNFQRRVNRNKFIRNKVKKIQGSIRGFVCGYCNEVYRNVTKYNEHIKYTKKQICTYCLDVIQFEDMKKHFQLHKPKSFLCDKCWEIFNEEIKLNQHMKVKHHKKYNHICFECKKHFPNENSLIIHVKMHVPKKCHKCSKQFQNNGCYFNHKKKCTGKLKKDKAKYICDYCSKEYDFKHAMQCHIILKHLEGWRFQCQYCGKKFPSLSRLMEHDNIHNKVLDRYVCSVCDKKYSSRKGFQEHCKVHSTEQNMIRLKKHSLTEMKKKLKLNSDHYLDI